MGRRTLWLIAVSIVRRSIALLGAWFVREGFVDHSLMQEGASVLAFLVVDSAWEFWLLHRLEVQRALYQRWLVLLGLKASPFVQPSTIVDAATERVRQGLQP